MSNRRVIVPIATVIGVILLVVAVVYFVDAAHSLPSFFPGHADASSKDAGHHHSKHGIAALVLALGAFAIAWFASGPKSASPA